MFEIPHYAADVYTKREDLRGTREHVLLVVRDYNRSVKTIHFYKLTTSAQKRVELLHWARPVKCFPL